MATYVLFYELDEYSNDFAREMAKSLPADFYVCSFDDTELYLIPDDYMPFWSQVPEDRTEWYPDIEFQN